MSVGIAHHIIILATKIIECLKEKKKMKRMGILILAIIAGVTAIIIYQNNKDDDIYLVSNPKIYQDQYGFSEVSLTLKKVKENECKNLQIYFEIENGNIKDEVWTSIDELPKLGEIKEYKNLSLYGASEISDLSGYSAEVTHMACLDFLD